MAAPTLQHQDRHHPDASLEDYLPPSPPLTQETFEPNFGYPSAHSEFRSESEGEEDQGETDRREDSVASVGGYSPPAWRSLGNGDKSSGFWRRPELTQRMGTDMTVRQQFGGFDRGGRSREPTPELELDTDSQMDDMILDRELDLESVFDGGGDVLERASRTRLPTGSLSPEKRRSPEPEEKKELRREPAIKEEDEQTDFLAGHKDVDNYIRFGIRAEVQQRTEPIETAINLIRSNVRYMTRSWTSIILSFLVAILSYSAMRHLFEPASDRPVPDLVKVAGIARSLEPLIYYSENGARQVHDLQATGTAVWDLGESVRSSNMTSAPMIVRQIDELAESLKTLALELTKFFANVDGDIDGILITMEWARRELGNLPPSHPPLSIAYDNIHNLLSSTGILEDPATGQPTRVGTITTNLFGLSNPQRTRAVLQRTFTEFLTVLEEAIATELTHSVALFALFEAIDRQFLNLARTVVREASVQDDAHSDTLSSLWTRILGPRASEVAKYERNRQLLQDVRAKTVRNKGVLVEHNQRLMTLKANLENLRRKLVSPLVRSGNSSSLTIEEQIRGLEDVGIYLEGVRERQKGKLLEMLYGSSRDGGRVVVEGRERRGVEGEGR